MSGKGFGERQPTKIDKLIESAVRYCHKRNPESLDQIFSDLDFLERSPVFDKTKLSSSVISTFP